MYAEKNGGRASAGRQSTDIVVSVLAERYPDIGEHLYSVSQLAGRARTQARSAAGRAHALIHAASLHDVGKIAVPDAILNKPGPLTEEEWQFIRQHTLIGERILGAAPALADAARLVRASHERVDGTGYPDGLSGDEIPLGSRIIGVCDAFDAMTSPRPYRVTPLSVEGALAELRENAGTQFDRTGGRDVLDEVLRTALREEHRPRSVLSEAIPRGPSFRLTSPGEGMNCGQRGREQAAGRGGCRWWPGGPGHRLLPCPARARFHDPRSGRRAGGRVARALGLAQAVHAGALRRAPRAGVPRRPGALPERDEVVGLPDRLRAPLRACRSSSTAACARSAGPMAPTWSSSTTVPTRPTRWWWPPAPSRSRSCRPSPSASIRRSSSSTAAPTDRRQPSPKARCSWSAVATPGSRSPRSCRRRGRSTSRSDRGRRRCLSASSVATCSGTSTRPG